jgi:hypothetical protein
MPSGGTPSAKDTLETYLFMLCIIYKQVRYDLGSNFVSTLWRNFMDRLRSMVRSVPGDTHWPNAAEKPVELVRTELASVWDSFPDLTFRSALKVAICHLNEKYRLIFQVISTINAPWRSSKETSSAGAAFIQPQSDCYATEFERFGSETGCYGRATK